MKSFSLALFILFIHNAAFTQNQFYPDLPWLLQMDMVVGKEIVRVGVKEIYKDGQVRYCVKISIDEDHSSSFEILANDFREGEYLNTLFFAKIKNIYEAFPSPDLGEKDKREVTEMAAQLRSPNIAFTEPRATLKRLIQRSANVPRMRIEKIREALEPILQTDTSEVQSDWLSIEMQTATSIIESQQATAMDNLRNAADTFLSGMHEMLLRRELEGPTVGVLYTKDRIQIWADREDNEWGKYFNKNTLSNRIRDQPIEELDKTVLAIKAVTLKFENGQIAGLKVIGSNLDYPSDIVFHSRIPFSYSTKADVSSDFNARNKRRIRLWSPMRELDGCYVFFDELIYNDYQVNNYSENYSPVDTVLTLRPFEPGRVLQKEKVTDLFQARIYTDLLGYGNDNPNGLVQAEISKKMFIRTGAKQFHRFLFFNTFGNVYGGIFHYIIPAISVTKTEKDNKFFPAPALSIPIDSLNSDIPSQVGTMDLLRYGNFFSGDELNVFYLGFPGIHSVIHFNIGGDLVLSGINKTSIVRDTGRNAIFSSSDEFNVASLALSPFILRWDLSPHPNYRVYLSSHLTHLKALDSRIVQIEKNLGRWYHQFSFLAAIKFSEDANGELFFRSRLSRNLADGSDIFFQTQIGYSFKVFTGKPETKRRAVFYDVF